MPGFNPETATDAEIAAQDFPPRPAADDTSLKAQAWHQYVRWYLAGDVWDCQNPPDGTKMVQPVRLDANPIQTGYYGHHQVWTDAETTFNVSYIGSTNNSIEQWMAWWPA